MTTDSMVLPCIRDRKLLMAIGGTQCQPLTLVLKYRLLQAY